MTSLDFPFTCVSLPSCSDGLPTDHPGRNPRLYNLPILFLSNHFSSSHHQHNKPPHIKTFTSNQNNNHFFQTLSNQPHQSTWIPSRTPATTSLTRFSPPPAVLPRRPTRRSPRTTTPESALVSRLLAMPSPTRLPSTSTTPRLRPTSRLLPTKQPFVEHTLSFSLT